jgi:protease-4
MVADIIKSIQKPTISVIDDGMAASAGYWIATAADEIYVTKETSEVGSVGVYCTLYDWKTYFEKEGLPVIEVYAPQSTEKNLDYRNALKGDEKLLKDSLRVLADQFIKTVSANRDGKLTSNEWNAGAMFYAKDAQKIGLIDGIKSLEQVVQRMDQLISNKNSSTSKNQNMSFKKTAGVAGVEGFQPLVKGVAVEVQEASVAVTEASMTAIEAAIEAGETAAADLATMTTTLTTEQENLRTASASLKTANESLKTAQDRIVELEAMGGKPSSTAKEEDKQEDVADSKKYETSYDRMFGG